MKVTESTPSRVFNLELTEEEAIDLLTLANLVMWYRESRVSTTAENLDRALRQHMLERNDDNINEIIVNRLYMDPQ